MGFAVEEFAPGGATLAVEERAPGGAALAAEEEEIAGMKRTKLSMLVSHRFQRWVV
jgi:hypothetical protein